MSSLTEIGKIVIFVLSKVPKVMTKGTFDGLRITLNVSQIAGNMAHLTFKPNLISIKVRRVCFVISDSVSKENTIKSFFAIWNQYNEKSFL